MEILLLVSVVLLILTSGLFGAAYSANAAKADIIFNLHRENASLSNRLLKKESETEIERKLWINKALVRGGGERLFDDVFKIKTSNAEQPPKNDADNNELLPPYTGQIEEWKREDAEKLRSIVPNPPTPAKAPANDLLNSDLLKDIEAEAAKHTEIN